MKYAKNYTEAKESFVRKATILEMDLKSYALKEGYSIDTASLVHEGSDKLIVVTTGLHGIEGYVGSALLHVFMEEYMYLLHSDVLLVHGINPAGMEQFRRVNQNQVDLNRNFLSSFEALEQRSNPSYQLISDFLNPSETGGYTKAGWTFFKGLLKVLMSGKPSALRESILKGQYENPKGIYYGGQRVQLEALTMTDIFREWLSKPYKSVVIIDIHTGYGPRYEMSLVNSMLEKTPSKNFVKAFDYQRVLGLNKEEFYEIEGDFIDHLYRLNAEIAPKRDFYGTVFEFGTLGDGLFNEIRSLKTMVLENAFHNDYLSEDSHSKITELMKALYMPSEIKWQEKCTQDFRRGLSGIVKYFNLHKAD